MTLPKPKIFRGAFIATALLASNINLASAQQSTVWTDYVRAQENGTALPIPNFAYAGYQRGEKPIPSPDWPVINVTDFGAIPNDNRDDSKAVQAAIDSASGMEQAIVLFPAGRFLMNETAGRTAPAIKVTGDNLIIRGAGSNSGGTELFFREALQNENPTSFGIPNMIEIFGSRQSFRGKQVTSLTRGNRLGAFTVRMADTSTLSPGDIVALNLNDPSAATDKVLAPYVVEPRFTEFKKGQFRTEYHRIDSINGAEVTFKEPLLTDIDAGVNWDVALMQWGSQFGLESMALRGNWKDNFVHFRSPRDNGGWTAVGIQKYADSWFKDLRFTDWNNTLGVKLSMNVTVKDSVVDGNRGHNAFDVLASTNVLLTNVHDRTKGGMWHSLGAEDKAGGTVIHRSSWPRETTFDAHAKFPYATLFDVVTGGFSDADGGSGGGANNLPNHMENLVMWNFKHLGTPGKSYNWWNTDSKFGRFLLPNLVGWHGAKPAFDNKQLGLNESFGTKVNVESLYEAQLALRFPSLTNSEGNLLKNSGFESNILKKGGFGLFANVPNWRNPNGLVEVWRNHRNYTAAEGESWVELDGNKGSSDALTQTAPVKVGQRYRLSFAYSARPGTDASSNQFVVKHNGKSLATLTENGRDLKDTQWRSYSVLVDANSASSAVSIEETSTDGVGAMIDAVSLVESNLPPLPNGDFENNSVATGRYELLNSVEGWRNSEGAIEVWRNHRGYKAADGASFVELDSTGRNTLYRDIATKSGQKYTLRFAAAPRPGVTAASNAFEVFWNDQRLMTISEDGKRLSHAAWKTYQIVVTGTGGNDRLSFREYDQDGVGALIDAVTVD